MGIITIRSCWQALTFCISASKRRSSVSLSSTPSTFRAPSNDDFCEYAASAARAALNCDTAADATAEISLDRVFSDFPPVIRDPDKAADAIVAASDFWEASREASDDVRAVVVVLEDEFVE